jgi:hypothetical protein
MDLNKIDRQEGQLRSQHQHVIAASSKLSEILLDQFDRSGRQDSQLAFQRQHFIHSIHQQVQLRHPGCLKYY